MRKNVLLGIGILVLGLIGSVAASNPMISGFSIPTKSEKGTVTFGEFNSITNSLKSISAIFMGVTSDLTEINFGKRIKVPEICIGNACETSWPSAPAQSWTTNEGDVSFMSGNVGIGISNPTTTLHVAGDITANTINATNITIAGESIIPNCSEGQAIIYSAGRLGCGTAAFTYAWTATDFTACSCDGNKSRTVNCKMNGSDIVADTECSGVKPEGTGVCTAPSGCFTWNIEAFSACSCAGSQTRAVTCIKDGNTSDIVSDSSCTSAKPAISQGCAASAICYSWVTSPYTAFDCNGDRSRSVTCTDSSGAPVAESNCTDTKPVDSEHNVVLIPSSCFGWIASPYSACTCAGTKARAVECKHSLTSVTVGDSKCSGLPSKYVTTFFRPLFY